MNYLVGVCVFERRTDLAGEFNDLLEIVRRRLAQVGTIHQLHNKERKAVVLSHVVDGDNVWMIQRCSGARFAHETRALLGGRTFFRGTATVSNNARAIFLGVPFTFTRSPFPLSPISSVLRPPILSARILTATGRNSSRSVARKTLPIAPRPISLSSR